MFGFGGKKTSTNTSSNSRVVGMELNSSFARATTLALGRTRPIFLDPPSETLPLFISLDRRLVVGTLAMEICRKSPHLICSNFLAQLGFARKWQVGRIVVDPDTALAAVFEKLRGPISDESDWLVLGVPAYLAVSQLKSVLNAAGKSRLRIRGSMASPLAIAAHRAEWLLSGSDIGKKPETTEEGDEGQVDWVVPIRTRQSGPCSVMIIDADEYSVHASMIDIDRKEVKLAATAAWPRVSVKIWKDRILDCVSDRCVRICRRDPRDSSDAEQSLYLQLDAAFERIALNQPVTLIVRGEHWYQDLPHPPAEFDRYCSPLAKFAAEGAFELLHSTTIPREVWLTHTATLLPGLAAAIRRILPEDCMIRALSRNAAADACAGLAIDFQNGRLPAAHLDSAVPLPQIESRGLSSPAE